MNELLLAEGGEKKGGGLTLVPVNLLTSDRLCIPPAVPTRFPRGGGLDFCLNMESFFTYISGWGLIFGTLTTCAPHFLSNSSVCTARNFILMYPSCTYLAGCSVASSTSA